MNSTLTVTTAATSTAMLTIAEMRAAAGVDGSAEDDILEALGAAVAADIMSECNIAVGDGADPTLFVETLTQTFWDWPPRIRLCLARRHNVVITSVTVDDAAVDADEYTVNGETGVLTRRNANWSSTGWCGETIVVVYAAGFTTLPADLKQIATDIFSSRYAEAHRDQFVKSETVDVVGVESRSQDFWVGSIPGQSNEGPIPGIIAGRLKRYRNQEIVIG